MEIIKTPAKESKCNKCDTVFEITNEDLNERKDANLWFNHGRYFLYCPICGQEHTFREMIREGGGI